MPVVNTETVTGRESPPDHDFHMEDIDNDNICRSYGSSIGARGFGDDFNRREIGRASCRERV